MQRTCETPRSRFERRPGGPRATSPGAQAPGRPEGRALSHPRLAHRPGLAASACGLGFRWAGREPRCGSRRGPERMLHVVGRRGLGSPGGHTCPGYTDPRAVRGSRGVRGVRGSRGDRGSLGDRGCRGSLGSRGTLGSLGARGTLGSLGSRGGRGTRGSRGTRGVLGIVGGRTASDGFEIVVSAPTRSRPESPHCPAA